MMDSTPSMFLLLALAAVAVLLLGGLVLSVVLIIGERTRVAGIVLLVLILLGVPLVGVGLAAFLWVGQPTYSPATDRQIRVPEVRVEPLRPPVEFVPPMPEAAEAVPTDEPPAAEDTDRPGQTEQPSTADEPQPDTADQQSDTNSGAGRQFPPGVHRRLNT